MNNEIFYVLNDDHIVTRQEVELAFYVTHGYHNTSKHEQENFKDVFPDQHKKYAERDGKMDIDTEAIISAFRLSCVQKDGVYVNGFREWKN